MDESTPTYKKIVSKHNGHLVMLYLTDYELGLSTKRRLRDTEVYSQEELERKLGLDEKHNVTSRTETLVYMMIIVALLAIVLFEVFKIV